VTSTENWAGNAEVEEVRVTVQDVKVGVKRIDNSVGERDAVEEPGRFLCRTKMAF
jgi:hypothetical protein